MALSEGVRASILLGLMPPTADAPHLSSSHGFSEGIVPEARGSSRSLDEVGAVTVLGAMVEQRKRSASVPAAIELEGPDADAIATQRRDRIDPSNDIFQKIR
jgi:hypothetical protein